MRGAWFLRDWVRVLQKSLLRETEADLREPPKSHFSYLSIACIGRSFSRLNCLDLSSAPLGLPCRESRWASLVAALVTGTTDELGSRDKQTCSLLRCTQIRNLISAWLKAFSSRLPRDNRPRIRFRLTSGTMHPVLKPSGMAASSFRPNWSTSRAVGRVPKRKGRVVGEGETEAGIPTDPEMPIEESDGWWVYQNQEPLVTSLETHDARFSKLHEILKKYGVHCLCTLPLTTAHSKVGTLTFGSKAPDVYTAEEIQFLSVVAEQIALAFDNALHFDASQASQQQLVRKNERLGLLLELTNHVVSNLEFRDVLRAVVASTRRVMGCDGAGITLPAADNEHFRIYAIDFPFSDESVQEESLVPMDEDISGAVFRTGKLWCASF